MKKRKRKRGKPGRPPKRTFDFSLDPGTVKMIAVIVLLVLAAIILLGIFGKAGELGTFSNKVIIFLFGWASFIAPLILIFAAYVLMRGKQKNIKILTYVGIFLFIICLLEIFHLKFFPSEAYNAVGEGIGGGYIGFFIADLMVRVVGVLVSWIIAVALLIISILLIFNIPFSTVIEKIKEAREKSKQLALKFKKKPGFKIKTIENGEEKDENQGELSDEKPEDAEDGREEGPEIASGPVGVNHGSISHEGIDAPQTFKQYTNWKFPASSLLNGTFSKPTSGDIRTKASIIQRTLSNFGIEVEMSDVSIGPTVTQYTLKPLEGVKLSKITTLQNDLALALAAHPLRIEAPIPGKSLVGVEVPNESIALVRIRELVESDEFKNHKSKLAFPLGRDVAGNPVILDIGKMPHLLIAGATGSGKSVCINAIITSLFYKNTPADTKLILIDPKRVEMTNYNGIPHLLTPVVTDVKKIVNSLRWAVAEMDRRYKLFQDVGCVNIKSYNVKRKGAKLPYILIFIDELADLMAVAANEVESAIVRLAQMARAVGIHLIVSTQRPSVNVITGLIKANITARIAFTVSSQIDSRTILDQQGAEKLLGNGDMLFITAEITKPKRIQGALVEENEIKNLTNYLRKQDKPSYDESVTEKKKSNGEIISSDAEEIDDELFDEAKQEIIRMGKGSASLLQRRLRIGYARAARLLDLLEQEGIVGPPDGSKPREVLVGKQDEEAMKMDEQKNKEDNGGNQEEDEMRG